MLSSSDVWKRKGEGIDFFRIKEETLGELGVEVEVLLFRVRAERKTRKCIWQAPKRVLPVPFAPSAPAAWLKAKRGMTTTSALP